MHEHHDDKAKCFLLAAALRLLIKCRLGNVLWMKLTLTTIRGWHKTSWRTFHVPPAAVLFSDEDKSTLLNWISVGERICWNEKEFSTGNLMDRDRWHEFSFNMNVSWDRLALAWNNSKINFNSIQAPLDRALLGIDPVRWIFLVPFWVRLRKLSCRWEINSNRFDWFASGRESVKNTFFCQPLESNHDKAWLKLNSI